MLEAARRLGHVSSEGYALCNLGIAYDDLGEPRKAIEYFERVLAIAQETGDRRGEGTPLGNLGLAYAALGQQRKAMSITSSALR